MEKCKRFRNRWTIKECLDLQREFELLKLSIDEIALRHKRTPNAIMLKLDEQNFADYNVLYSNYHNINSPLDVIRKHTYDEFDDNIVNNFIDESEEQNEWNPEDEEELSELDEQEEEQNNEFDSLIKRIGLLESRVATLTELLVKQSNTKKSVFSLFS